MRIVGEELTAGKKVKYVITDAMLEIVKIRMSPKVYYPDVNLRVLRPVDT